MDKSLGFAPVRNGCIAMPCRNDRKENLEVRRESGQHRRLAAWVALEQVIGVVGRENKDCANDELSSEGVEHIS